jgi:hypothetical protein
LIACEFYAIYVVQVFACIIPTSWDWYDWLLYLSLAAFSCYGPSELVNGPQAEAVGLFEAFAAATRGCNFSCLTKIQILHIIRLHFAVPFSLFIYKFLFVELLLVFLIYFSFGIRVIELIMTSPILNTQVFCDWNCTCLYLYLYH